jgi:hypothetical protein
VARPHPASSFRSARTSTEHPSGCDARAGRNAVR